MSKSTSFFLDLLRVAAAFLVFVVHCTNFWCPAVFPFMARLGHGAVIVFFVLSGYVIAYSTLSRAQKLKDYVVARLSRLYSVVIPALLLTAVLQVFGTATGSPIYTGLHPGFDAVRYALASVFLQNIWHLSASPSSNSPLWSLGYEFWYYVLFGVALFTRSTSQKVILLLIVSLIVGPNILLLLPCWGLGVLLYLVQGRMLIRKYTALVGFLFFSGLMIQTIVFLQYFPYGVGHKPLIYSGAFVSDFIKALLVSLTIFFFDRAFHSVNLAPTIQSAVRFGSDHTFSLYLYHYPMIAFVTAINLVTPASPNWKKLFFAAVILSLVILFSTFTEAKRGVWRRFFSRSWDFCPLSQAEKAILANNSKPDEI